MRLALSAAFLGVFLSSAQAFDCAKAATGVERAICSNDDLKALDDALGSAYGELRMQAAGTGRKMLAASQKRWIADREASCGQDDAAIMQCVSDMTAERLRLFRGSPETGPGVEGRIVPGFIVQEGSETQYDLDIVMLRFAESRTDGQRRFNAISDEITGRIKIGPHGQDTSGQTYSIQEDMSLTYAGPKLVSVLHSFYNETGGAHGNGGSQAFNFDPQTGKDYEIGDFFTEDAASKLMNNCKAQIIADKRRIFSGENEDYDPARDEFLKDDVIAEHIATMASWSFREGEASVSFDRYVIGAYAEGDYSCRFDMVELRKMALPGAPLP